MVGGTTTLRSSEPRMCQLEEFERICVCVCGDWNKLTKKLADLFAKMSHCCRCEHEEEEEECSEWMNE